MSEAQKILTVAGMHRSGSSMTANWLLECGLNIGTELLENCPDNERGHFEDMDFLTLHQHILADNGLDYLVKGNTQVPISEARRKEAEAILAARQALPEWGWKEPRTCLFLDFWKELIPHLKFLVIYRHYDEVVDSLMRRELLPHLQRNKFWHPWQFSTKNPWLTKKLLQVWDRHNRDILQIVNQYPDDALVFRISDVRTQSITIVKMINEQWGFHLKERDISVIYEGALMKKEQQEKEHYTSNIDKRAPEVRETWKQLEEWRARCLAGVA